MTDPMLKVISEKLREGYVQDLRKPDIDPFERAAILATFLEDKKWSVREMARQLSIPKSTLEDWLLFTRISETEYNGLRKKSHTPTQIYRELREGRESTAGRQKARVGGAKSFDAADTNLFLRDVAIRVRSAILRNAFDGSTSRLVHDARNELNRLDSAIERKDRKGVKH
jgi:hypothetical protein